ncbi:MAG TPA: phenylalanine--tRNA ligase subunit beta [Candidatus Limnocylindria bacterium]|jgi:phenylalanyl-tRNA synthetase beta chain|nr:phenylalanine--tRNA ligase subunit beta [Candidatus Limnocylindria bacterium]
MKITLNWLRQYVDFTWTPEEMTERLTMLGLEVEGVQKLAGEFEGVVVAEVLTRDKHPNADKLSVCRVADGRGERQIVCGAQNFKVGDKVPLILPGATLPPKPGDKEPFTIKVGKIRSVESHGMMCSGEELGLPSQEDGLLILSPDAKVGQPLAEYLGRSGSDVVYDLEVTPNRPDLNSVIGIAREIASVTGSPLRVPEVNLTASETGKAVAESVAIRIEDPALCPRYSARIVRGVKVGPSPDWLRTTLEKVGLRSISNVVDVTNYVMLETGQPLHAFDLHLIAAAESDVPTIVVRRATADESFTTLDGQARKLSTEMLLIADSAKGIALAGVMGGLNTEIRPETTDLLLESAYFSPTNIRRTSKTLGLRTDASYRFERGADVECAEYASRRAVQLLLKVAGGELAAGVVDAYPAPVVRREITLRHARTDALLGISIPAETQRRFLAKLDLEEVSATAETSTWRVPAFRVDLKREADLIEEVCRLHGVDKIPSTTPRGALGSHPFDAVYDVLMEARRILSGLGLNEAQGQTLVDGRAASLVAPNDRVLLANPLSSEMDALRPSLLPGLLDTLRHNLSRKNGDVQLFEIGRTFRLVNGEPKEGWRVAFALTGARRPATWSGAERDEKCDVYDLKGILEEFLEQFGLRGFVFTKQTEPGALFLESAAVSLGGKVELGQMGQLTPKLARQYDLRDAVLLAELNLDLLLSRRQAAKTAKILPHLPSTRRDIAMLVPDATTHDAVLAVVRQAKPAFLESVELFDVFRGKNVPEGQKSLAYAFTYRGTERTLRDEEVNASHQKVVDAFRQTLQATLRE